MAGVAESTVSRALNDSPQISEVVKERVRNVAEHLGYIPNRQAVLLARNKTFVSDWLSKPIRISALSAGRISLGSLTVFWFEPKPTDTVSMS